MTRVGCERNGAGVSTTVRGVARRGAPQVRHPALARVSN
jgi:hypothetical protein